MRSSTFWDGVDKIPAGSKKKKRTAFPVFNSGLKIFHQLMLESSGTWPTSDRWRMRNTTWMFNRGTPGGSNLIAIVREGHHWIQEFPHQPPRAFTVKVYGFLFLWKRRKFKECCIIDTFMNWVENCLIQMMISPYFKEKWRNGYGKNWSEHWSFFVICKV